MAGILSAAQVPPLPFPLNMDGLTLVNTTPPTPTQMSFYFSPCPTISESRFSMQELPPRSCANLCHPGCGASWWLSARGGVSGDAFPQILVKPLLVRAGPSAIHGLLCTSHAFPLTAYHIQYCFSSASGRPPRGLPRPTSPPSSTT